MSGRRNARIHHVLILIVLEVGLGQLDLLIPIQFKKRLNPYCIGSRSWTQVSATNRRVAARSLNPYCIGSRSWTMWSFFRVSMASMRLNPYCIGSRSWTNSIFRIPYPMHSVLILIVLEVGLGQLWKLYYQNIFNAVLILIVLEVGLGLRQYRGPCTEARRS